MFGFANADAMEGRFRKSRSVTFLGKLGSSAV